MKPYLKLTPESWLQNRVIQKTLGPKQNGKKALQTMVDCGSSDGGWARVTTPEGGGTTLL